MARQRLGQHWFITIDIAFYIQGLHTMYNSAGVRSTVAVVGLAHRVDITIRVEAGGLAQRC
jgi:hypothetical protein